MLAIRAHPASACLGRLWFLLYYSTPGAFSTSAYLGQLSHLTADHFGIPRADNHYGHRTHRGFPPPSASLPSTRASPFFVFQSLLFFFFEGKAYPAAYPLAPFQAPFPSSSSSTRPVGRVSRRCKGFGQGSVHLAGLFPEVRALRCLRCMGFIVAFGVVGHVEDAMDKDYWNQVITGRASQVRAIPGRVVILMRLCLAHHSGTGGSGDMS